MISALSAYATLLVQPRLPQHSSNPSTQVVTEAQFGKYRVFLRVPEEGVFAGEEIDIEFRVEDTTAKDPIEPGFKGIGGLSATATLTMPSMPGMPEAKPKVHREGVPGDYGLELFFPHGGDYRIDLDLKLPDGNIQRVVFVLDVKDERPNSGKKPQPYSLKLVDWPKNAQAGRIYPLKLQVIDNKTKRAQTSFDIAHEMKFHLLLASKDLNWFLHEHPTMGADGTWTIPMKFPAGGDYWIYGDVAPTGKGSRVVMTKLKVSGKKPQWDTRLRLSNRAVDGGLKGAFSSLEPVEVGKKATLQVKLFDAKTGQAAGDTAPWLGAAGHMMIFHKDGQTVVHSHPNEDEENEVLVKRGIVRFTGRFPKPGTYKVYAQFKWRGAIRTLGFGVNVKGDTE